MFTLITDISRYFKVKRGQSSGEIEKELNTPVGGSVFCGRIIAVRQNLCVVKADVGDSYRTLAAKYNVDETELKTLNDGKPVYPTCKIFVPKLNAANAHIGRGI